MVLQVSGLMQTIEKVVFGHKLAGFLQENRLQKYISTEYMFLYIIAFRVLFLFSLYL